MNIPKALEFNLILEKLADKTVSPSGAAAAMAIEPESTMEAAKRAMQKTMEAETLLIKRPDYPMRSFSLIDAELARMKTGAALSCGELLRSAGVFRAAKAAALLAKDENAEMIAELARGLFYDGQALRRITDCILSEDEISDDASAELARVRRAMRREQEAIKEKLQSMIRSQGDSKYLQDNIVTQRNGRYVVPVKAEYKANVPGIVHEKSASGATMFIEPAGVVESNNRLRELEAEQAREVSRILAALTGMLSPFHEELRRDVEILTELDVLFAKAALGIEMHGVPVSFNANKTLELYDARHPLIAAKEVVPITISMKNGIHALVVTGPNTGGKTVTLKLLGLFAVMAQSGMFLPAKSPVRMPVFDGVFADIGDEQSIEQSLSTFSAHMKNIIFALLHAHGDSLVLLDELGAGTDPQEGSALAQAVLAELDSKGCTVIATTHIGELKVFAGEHDGFENASMEFDAVTLTPTYRLLMGVAGRSNALSISQKLGLPKHVLQSARSYMNEEHVEYSRLIETAEKAQSRADKMMNQAYQALEEAKKERKRAQEEAQQLNDKRKHMLEQANEKAIEILSDAKETAEEAIKETRKLKQQNESERTKTVKKVRDKIADKKQIIEKHKKLQKKVKNLSPDDIRMGDMVTILSMNAPATVLEPPNSRGMVRLQAGIMQVELHYTELAPGAQIKKDAARLSHIRLNTGKAVPIELDLHGQAVDDALIVLDKYLDDAFLAGYSEVHIVHGRGTGVLRSGVQQYLRTHPHVAKQRLGEYGEGGIGVTVVTLK
ncbi:MAG: endonuclease MutS2 [Christensenella sp.]